MVFTYIIAGILAGVGLLIAIFILWKIIHSLMKRAIVLLINSLFGLAALLILNYLGINIPIILATILITGIFGIPGILTLVILNWFGLI